MNREDRLAQQLARQIERLTGYEIDLVRTFNRWKKARDAMRRTERELDKLARARDFEHRYEQHEAAKAARLLEP